MELADYSRFMFALAFVVGLIWLTAYMLKRTGLDKRLRGVTGQNGRLAVVDVLYLDPRRKLTLVRADAREYLLLIAGDTAQVIDTLEAKNHEPVA
ncbi:MAG: FliO/MopB family protein [Rickettsiales bacterium]